MCCVRFQVQTGTVAGFSYGDKVMLYHLLYPGLQVEGTIIAAQALNCTVKIVKEESLMKLSKAITDIYQVQYALYIVEPAYCGPNSSLFVQ